MILFVFHEKMYNSYFVLQYHNGDHQFCFKHMYMESQALQQIYTLFNYIINNNNGIMYTKSTLGTCYIIDEQCAFVISHSANI